MPDETLEAIRGEYRFLTTIEKDLKFVLNDGLNGLPAVDAERLEETLKRIEQHKADLFSKYNV